MTDDRSGPISGLLGHRRSVIVSLTMRETVACGRGEKGREYPPGPARRVQNVGIVTFSPFFNADSWAQRPTIVQLAEVSASGSAGRSPRTALIQAWTRCGCEPPWPPPC